MPQEQRPSEDVHRDREEPRPMWRPLTDEEKERLIPEPRSHITGGHRRRVY